jgi:hypothetical protein
MLIRYGATALAMVVAGLVALSANYAPQLTEAQEREVETILEVFEDVEDGDPAPNQLSLAWAGEHVLKAEQDYLYVPFSVTLDRAAVTTNELAVYWRVVPKTEKPDPDAEFAFENLNFATLPASGPAMISRAFSVPAGTYDVYVLVKEPEPTKRGQPRPKISVVQHTVELPNLWTTELTTSSLILADRIDQLAAPLTPEQMGERPYALGSMEVLPAQDMEFTTQQSFGLIYVVYNARANAANKPDVTIEYNFYTTKDGAEEFYNKTPVQEMNATTLPPDFNLALGHQLQTGQQIPLASFPPGQYRLDITITDRLANATIKREVKFSVTGA